MTPRLPLGALGLVLAVHPGALVVLVWLAVSLAVGRWAQG